MSSYPRSDATGDYDTELAERKGAETTVAERDFTGPDYSGWAWHLFKPDAPYAAMGEHPSGTGLDRYKGAGDLAPQELRFLKRAGNLLMLNYASPMSVGAYRIPLGRSHYANFAVRTFLNGFGYDINPELYLKTPRLNLYAGVHSYHNHNHGFLGFDAALRKNAFTNAGKELLGDVRMMVWDQPRNLAFETDRGSVGGSIAGKIYYPANDWLLGTVELDAKSRGWVAGNPFHDESVSVRLGVTMKVARPAGT